MDLDLAAVAPDDDAAPVLQAALDSGLPVRLPERPLDKDGNPKPIVIRRPVYLTSRPDNKVELVGCGRASPVWASADTDGFVALPGGIRNYDPTSHFSPNPLGAGHYSYRTLGSSGIRFHNTIADRGPPGKKFWSGVRRFTVEMMMTRHPNSKGGTICGMAWRMPGRYDPAPWTVEDKQGDWDWREYVDLRLGLTTGVVVYRYRVGPPGTQNTYRFRVDLDAGLVVLELDGAPLVPSHVMGGGVQPGAVLVENPGSPMWVGCGDTQGGGGKAPPELGNADVTLDTFRVWETALPPPLGSYDPWSWAGGSLYFLTFEDSRKPRAGDPAVYFTGRMTGYAYLVPLSSSLPDGWAGPIKADNLCVRGSSYKGTGYGAGFSVQSSLDVTVTRPEFDGFNVGFQVMGGPLPSYPVRVSKISGRNQTDCLVRIQRATVRECSGLTARYPVRSVARFDQCGEVWLDDVVHAPDSNHSVGDCLRFDGCGVVDVDRGMFDYEDGNQDGGPRNSYVRLTGWHDDLLVQVVRIRNCWKTALRPGARYVDCLGLPEAAVVTLENAFGMRDGTYLYSGPR
jgi:hypothetical protein